jgi:hypothetical protein
LRIPFADDFEKASKESDYIIDAIFGKQSIDPLHPLFPVQNNGSIGFSFKGEVREPFPRVIEVKIPFTVLWVFMNFQIHSECRPLGNFVAERTVRRLR